MLKGFGLRISNQKLKKVVPVDSSSSALMYPRDCTPPPGTVASTDVFDVNMLDYMGLDDFLEVMHSKIEQNDAALWMAAKSLAGQLKGSKALLSINSLVPSGKSFAEELVVTYSNDKKSIGRVVNQNDSVYGDVISQKKCIGKELDNNCDPSLYGNSFASRSILCAPVISDNSVCGIIQVCRSKDLEVSGAVDAGCFDMNDELMIGFIASNISILVNYVEKEKYGTKSNNDQRLLKDGDSSVGSFSETCGTANPTVPSLIKEINMMIEIYINDLYSYLKADRISVFLRKNDSNYLECVISQDIKGSRIPLGTGFTGLVMNSNDVFNIPDAATNSQHYNKFDNISKFKTQSVLCAPLRHVDGRPVGVVQALNKNNGQEEFSEKDEKYIQLMCSKLSVFFQMAQEVEEDLYNRVTSGAMSKWLNKMLCCNSLKSLSDVATKEIMNRVSLDYVQIFVFEPSDGCAKLRKLDDGEGAGRIADEAMQMQMNQLREFDPIVPEKPIAIPIEILDAIRTGVQWSLSTDDQSTLNDKLIEYLGTIHPGLPALKAVIVSPIGSNATSGVPATHVLIAGRYEEKSTLFNALESRTLSACTELLSSAIASLRKVKEKELQLKNMSFHFNMVISALTLLHKYVILLDKDGNVIACNRSIDGLLGKVPRSANGHISKWFDEDQEVVLNGIMSVLKTGVPVTSSDDVVIVTTECPEGVGISYQICAVNNKGTILHTEHEQEGQAGAEIHAVIVILHVNAVAPEEQAPEVDTAIVSGTSGLQESLKTVVDSLTSIVGDFKLDTDDHKLVTRISSDIMKAGKNIQLSISLGADADPVEGTEQLVEIVEHSDANSPLLICPEALAIEDLFTWEFDVMLYKSQTTLRGILFLIFRKMFNFAEINIDVRKLCSFFQEAEKHYHMNPFHNFYHITCVTHFAYMLITSSEAHKFVSVTNLFAVMLSAVVHDIDHPGNSNLFEINSQSELALLYNDQSVLENHHCSTAFRIMRNKNMDVLEGMLDAKDVKKTMVSCIMATDMSVHFDLIEKVKIKIMDGWDFSDSNDTFFLCRILLHAADLSNPVRPYHMSKYWAGKITEEFNNQVELERSLCLPVLGFMITSDEKSFCKNEIGFASFVVAPMWRSLELLFPAFKPLVVQLDKNLDIWRQRLVEIAAEEEAANTSSSTE